jgi:hypothetical protein
MWNNMNGGVPPTVLLSMIVVEGFAPASVTLLETLGRATGPAAELWSTELRVYVPTGREITSSPEPAVQPSTAVSVFAAWIASPRVQSPDEPGCAAVVLTEMVAALAGVAHAKVPATTAAGRTIRIRRVKRVKTPSIAQSADRVLIGVLSPCLKKKSRDPVGARVG